MKLSKTEQEHLYNELYHMDGLGLSDYLNDWIKDGRSLLDDFKGKLLIVSSQHGEKVFIRGQRYEFGAVDLFNRWDLWRQEVAYYFDAFIKEQETLKNGFEDIETIKEYFIFKMCCIMNIINDVEEYLKINVPDCAKNDPFLFM